MWHKIFGFNKVLSFRILHQGYPHFPSGWEGVCTLPHLDKVLPVKLSPTQCVNILTVWK